MIGRRGFLVAAGVAGLAGCTAAERSAPAAPPVSRQPAVPHQPGVVTPASAETEFVAFDVTASNRKGLAEVLLALSEPVAGATVTIAAGASLFDDRFGIERPRRQALEKYLLPFGGGYYFVLPGGGDYVGHVMLT